MAKSKQSIAKTNKFLKRREERKLREYIHTFGSNHQKEGEDLVLYNCGFEDCQKGHYFGPLARDFHIIHFVTEGEGTLTIDHITYPVGKNQAFLIPANKVAKYEASKTNPWKYYWFGFMGIKAREYIYQIMNTRETPVIIDIEDLSAFQETIQTMVDIGESGISLKNHFRYPRLYVPSPRSLSRDNKATCTTNNSRSLYLPSPNLYQQKFRPTNPNSHNRKQARPSSQLLNSTI